jgi:hypothetical protein
MGAKHGVFAGVCASWIAALFACGDSHPTGSGSGVSSVVESGAPRGRAERALRRVVQRGA